MADEVINTSFEGFFFLPNGFVILGLWRAVCLFHLTFLSLIFVTVLCKKCYANKMEIEEHARACYVY